MLSPKNTSYHFECSVIGIRADALENNLKENV